MSTAITHIHAALDLRARELVEAARIRQLEECEISALASLCDPPNAEGWITSECHECLEIETLKGSQRELAEHLYNAGYMVYHRQMICRECQAR